MQLIEAWRLQSKPSQHHGMMKLPIPDYIHTIAPYKPGKPIEEFQREYGFADPVKLASNENPLGPSPLAVNALQCGLNKLNRYPDGSGRDLVEKISKTFGIATESIVIGNGSDDILGLLIQAFLRPGDEAVIPDPSFLMYKNGVLASGATPVLIPLNELVIDLDAMLDAVNRNTKVMFICNPNNPTGTVVSRQAFEHFLHRLPEGVVVILDEAYIEFAGGEDCFSGIEYLDMNIPLAVLRTFSKAYGLAGLRIGYGFMPKAMVDMIHRIRQPFNTGTLAQLGAEAALDDVSFLEKTVETVHEGIDLLNKGLDRLGIRYFSTKANFFLVDVQRDADAVFEDMLQQGVIVRSMSAYGYPTYIRVNVGLEEENRRFLKALERVWVKQSGESDPR